MSSMLALVTPLWSDIVVLWQSVDWFSILAFLAASGAMTLVAKVWASRGLWGAKVPFLAAAFELLDVFGFSPPLLAVWVKRRSWFRKGSGEVERVRRVWPGSLVFALVLCSCSPASSGMCPVFDASRVTIPAALAIARATLDIASDSCGDGCTSELGVVRSSVESADAALPEVCRAVQALGAVPCEKCAAPLARITAMVDCHGLK
jgi:hypothetical protein